MKRSLAETGPSGREPPEANSERTSGAPDDESLFGQGAVRETIDALIGAVTAGSGTILLTGNPGTGKTVIVKRLERELRAAGCTVVGFNCTSLEGSDRLVQPLSNDQGMAPAGGRIDRWLERFYYFAARANKNGAPIVLVIDGAERLSSDLRSRLGQLVSPAESKPSSLRLVLAGRPEILSLAELQPDHDLGRSIRLARRLEWPADSGPTDSCAASDEKMERSGDGIAPAELCSEAASGPPGASTGHRGIHPVADERPAGHATLEEIGTEPSHPAPARSTRRIRAARFVAAGCVAAGFIGFAVTVGAWLVTEKSRPLRNPPAGHERMAETVSTEVRGASAASRTGAVRLPDEALATLLIRGEELLVLAAKAARDQKARAATSIAATPIFQQPRQLSTPPHGSAGPDVASRLSTMIKASNLSDRQKMIIQAASMLGAGEFCLGQGVDYRNLAETMTARWRRNPKSVDLPTQMSIDFGMQIGREGRVYEYRKGTVIDFATIPDPKSSCDHIHREVVRISQMKWP